MVLTLEYDQALIVLLQAKGCPELTDRERELFSRLWASHCIAVATIPVSSAGSARAAELEQRCGSHGSCHDGSESSLLDYDAVVADYIRSHRPRAAREVDFFRKLPSLSDAVHFAALARTASGKRHDHQRRISASALSEAEQRLQAAMPTLKKCHDFADLHVALETMLRPVHGLGDLYMYDTATRIGAFLGLEPEQVYLHAGTAVGARALGFNGTDVLDPATLPPAFRALKPREVEDCLCIYKGDLSLLQAPGRRSF
jgi:hypothetical protein